MSKFTDAIQIGIEADEPAANSVPVGALYSVTDSTPPRIDRSNGTTWDVYMEGGGAAVDDATIATTDITTNNASTSKHGWLKKLDNNAAHFMDGTGAWSTPAADSDATLTTTDITTNNASTSKHGFLKKLDNDATHFMDGTGAWSVPPVTTDATLTTTDITTNNASTSKHGFLKKLNNDATYYMDGTGAWSIPAGGGGGALTVEEVDGSPTDSAVTKIKFPNDTLTIASHVATYRPFSFGQPQGALERSYTFDSTVESWTNADGGTLTNVSGKLNFAGGTNSIAMEPSGAANVADGELYADFIISTTGTSNGVTFRLTDHDNYYLWIWSPLGNITLYKKAGGSFIAIQTYGTYPFHTGAVARVLVRFVGSKLSLYLNGTHIITVVDTTYTTGRIGLFANGGVSQYDTVRLYSLSSGWIAPI